MDLPRPTSRVRRGAALPVVLLLMLIFGVMGVAFMQMGSGGYRLTAQSAQRLRLEETVVSVLDEARYRLFQNTSTLGIDRGQAGAPRPVLREMLFDAIREVNGDYTKLEVPFDLTEILTWSKALATNTDPDFDLIEATAFFYGFRPIVLSDDGNYPGAAPSGQGQLEISDWYESLYVNPDTNELEHLFPEDKHAPPADLQGYCTITIHLKLRGLQRQIAVTHDVKVVDARPPAERFALFAWRNTYGDDQRMLAALNQGDGKMAIYPQLVGRMHIKGPYVLNVEGHSDGLGGGRPRPSASAPRTRPAWSGWSQVPVRRAMRLEAWRLFQNEMARPSKPCLNCDDGVYATAGPGGGPTAVTDRAIFALEFPYLTSSVPHGFQRFFMNGEPHAKDSQRDENRVPGLGSDAWRGPLIRMKKEKRNGEDVLVPEVHVFTQDDGWERDGEDLDQLLVEPGGNTTLWRPVKRYWFRQEGCPRPGVTWNPITWIQRGGSYLRSLACTVVDVAGFGFVGMRPYKREPVEAPIPDIDVRALEDLTGKMAGVDNAKADETQTYLSPFSMGYEIEETLSGWLSALNVGVNAVSAVLTVLTLGTGSAAIIPLKAAIPAWIGVAGADIAGNALLPSGQAGQTDSLAPTVVTSPPPDANIQDEEKPTPPPEIRVATFDEAVKRGQHQQWAEVTAKGNEVLYQLMTGDLTTAANVSVQDLDRYRELENRHLMDGEIDQHLFKSRGYLPPHLKPYMRLASQVHPHLYDLVGDGTRPLELEGVVAVEQLPQKEDNFAANIQYLGRGILFSGSRGNTTNIGDTPPDPNREPVFGGSITPRNRENDWLTMVYWSGADPQEAGVGSGLGMLGLTQPRNEGSFVSPYGVRPLGPYASIRGNLVTGYVDRHRFPSDATLRVFYDWQLLAPDLGKTDEQEQQQVREKREGAFLSVAVSPKIAGWYDYLKD